jgi:hypothetical protein
MKTKNTFKIVFAAILVLSVCTGNPVTGFMAVVGLGLAFTDAASFKALAMFTLVPAVVRDLGYNTGAPEVPPFTRAQKFLFDFLRNKSNAVTLDAYLNQSIFFDPINYYVRYVLPPAQQGRVQILGGFTTQIVGVTNFYAQGLLPQYYNFCFDRLQVNYGTIAAAGAAVQSITGWTNVRGSMPAALGNGDIIILLNKQIIVQSGIVDYTSEAAITGGNSLDFAGGALQVPRVLQENLTIECDLNLAQNQAIPNTANTTFAAEVLFKGVQLRLRS